MYHRLLRATSIAGPAKRSCAAERILSRSDGLWESQRVMRHPALYTLRSNSSHAVQARNVDRGGLVICEQLSVVSVYRHGQSRALWHFQRPYLAVRFASHKMGTGNTPTAFSCPHADSGIPITRIVPQTPRKTEAHRVEVRLNSSKLTMRLRQEWHSFR